MAMERDARRQGAGRWRCVGGVGGLDGPAPPTARRASGYGAGDEQWRVELQRVSSAIPAEGWSRAERACVVHVVSRDRQRFLGLGLLSGEQWTRARGGQLRCAPLAVGGIQLRPARRG